MRTFGIRYIKTKINNNRITKKAPINRFDFLFIGAFFIALITNLKVMNYTLKLLVGINQ